ncbi:ricin B lectin [Colletotrichum navitas]|uniref:Ricin B lectin n=1 Tax=Colletotrichum navitas TaxID=681940 RepID=A0AAD8Q2Z8_9PEZI|nr:ricin B lectin [Colletotrichum navitas]KAK1594961.1 ricin B lectin [Colletotrichum navitas]
MKVSILTTIVATASVAQAAINWTLEKAANPTDDQLDAYAKIEEAMKLAAERHARLGTAQKTITVTYTPGVPTAEANTGGTLRFGTSRDFMTERTALHEISHTLGVGLSDGYKSRCASGDWPTALPLLRSWDGDDATIHCGGYHFWPYGLNYDNEWSDEAADRHVLLINAMLADGMAA